jgi:hypothetical protein
MSPSCTQSSKRLLCNSLTTTSARSMATLWTGKKLKKLLSSQGNGKKTSGIRRHNLQRQTSIRILGRRSQGLIV